MLGCLSPCQWVVATSYKSKLSPNFQLLNSRDLEDLAQTTILVAPLSCLFEDFAVADGVWHDWGTWPVLHTGTPRDASPSLRTLVALAGAIFDEGGGAEDGSPNPHQHPVDGAVARACLNIDPALGRRAPGQVCEGSSPWTVDKRWACHRLAGWSLAERWGPASVMSGDAERVLERCSTVLLRGEFVFLNDRDRQRLQRELQEVARCGLVAVALAFLPLPASAPFPGPRGPADFPTSGLSFVGYFTVRWSARRDAPDTVSLAMRKAVRLLLSTPQPLPWAQSVAEAGLLGPVVPPGGLSPVVAAAEVAHDPWNVKSEVLHRPVSVVVGLQRGGLARVVSELTAAGDTALVVGKGTDELEAMRMGRGVAWGGELAGVPPREAEGAVRGFVADRCLATAIAAVAEAREVAGGALWWPDKASPCASGYDDQRAAAYTGPPYPYMHH